MAKEEVKIKNSKTKSKIVPSLGSVYVSSSSNNTIVSITDDKGNVFYNGSTGMFGFKGSRKSTPYAATKVAEELGSKAYASGLREVNIFVKGIGQGRVSAIKAMKSSGIKVLSITDKTPMPHNGCRPRKRRRT
jgi:small subunit ribosomal protein S11